MTDVTHERFVITSDASPAELHAVNIDRLCAALRLRPQISNFSKQVIIIDACSIWSSEGYEPTSLCVNLKTATQQRIEQERVYASLNGQAALIRKGAIRSDFTSLLLGLLSGRPISSLDMDELWGELKSITDKSNSPCLIDREDPYGRRTSARGSRENSGSRRTIELSDIIEKQAAIPLEKLQRFFRESTQCEDETLVPSSSSALVWQLDELTRRGSAALANSEWFALRLEFEVSRLIEDNPTAKRRRALKSLKKELALWLGGCDQSAYMQDAGSLKASLASPPILFVDLAPEQMRIWIHMGNWRFVAAQELRANIEENLASAWNAAIGANFASRDCHLELAVGFDDLQHIPPKSAIEPKRMKRAGREIPFTVRLRERWTDPELRSNWVAAYEHSRELLDRRPDIDWLDERATGDASRTVAPSSWVAVHDISQPLLFDCFYIHLEQGAPWALLCCKTPTTTERELIAKHARTHTLRDSMRTARTMADWVLKTGSGPDVVLMVDRPDRLPPGAADRLTIP